MTDTVQPKIRPTSDFTPAQLQTAQERLTSATIWLMRNEAFYSTLLLGLTQKTFHGTMGVTADELYFDPEYIIDETQFSLRFKLMHEVLHVALKHWDPRRLAAYSHDIRNQAYDYAINGMIVEAGRLKRQATGVWDVSYQMPDDGLYDEEYLGMLPEEIAALLQQKQNQEKPQQGKGGDGDGDGDGQGEGESQGNPGDGQSGGGTGKWGEVFTAQGTNQQLDDLDEEMERNVQRAENAAKSRGQMPAHIQEAIDELRNPTPEWQDRLLEIMRDHAPSDLSFSQPNRMFMNSDIVMPTVERTGIGHVAFFIDQSGSVSHEEMVQFFSDIHFIFEDLHPERITIIAFDYEASEPQTYEPGDDLPYVRERMGGTRFSAAFEKARECDIEEDIDLAIVLTDGEDCSYPDFVPDYDVIWGTTGAFYGGDPEFGTILPIKFGGD